MLLRARIARPIWKPELAVFALVSALLHFWRLFTPSAVIFDEAHYKRFAGHYLDGSFYYDVHPPLANLLYAAVAKLAGIPAATLLAVGEPTPALRVLPAFFGAIVVPLVYVILRQLGAARRVASLGAFAILCENALLADSRFALVEPLLIGFGMCAIAFYLAAREREGGSRLGCLTAAAVFSGLALSCKWTGASALGLIGLAWLFDVWKTRPIRYAEGALLAMIPLAIYLSVFAVHFALVPRYGQDTAMFSTRFRATLIGGPQYDRGARISFASKIAEVHDAMRRGNRSLEQVVHPASSPWYTWPIMKHPIALYQELRPDSQTNIVLLGNPVVWWGSLVATGVIALALVRRRARFAGHEFALAFLGGGVAMNFIPFMAIARVMYIYHYLFALVFMVMFATYGLGVIAGWNAGDDSVLLSLTSRRAARSYAVVAALVFVGFLYFLPLTFGWSLSNTAFARRERVLHPF
jgi:dolichyl-phosphate-mannose-protein mannosyltransferase